MPAILDQLSQLEVTSGNWTLARRHAQEQVEVAERAGQETERWWGRETIASIDAREGHLARAEASIAEYLEAARGVGDPMSIGFGLRTLGFVALSSGDPRTAVDAFTELDEIAGRIGVTSPGTFRGEGDHIEALIELGRLDRADSLLEYLAERAHVINSTAALNSCAMPRAAPGGSRCPRGRVYTRRAVNSAGRTTRDAVRARPCVCGQGTGSPPAPREASGQQRTRERGADFRPARRRHWAARARAEARRLGLRPRAPQHLTETEARVAELAASGLANPDIAARLFMSRKTVEFNLSKAYHKLGVRGRAQLAAHLPVSAQRPPAAD